ncbi:Tic22-like family [Musa troglodytarum]|uniref:Tic22-like family n=1 Tax=Musa troglodytarum TaxID=320322 RepID=A0A9E7EFT4_9LILI|nr:Tic22-like family [Musa troglodytarum]
MWEETQRAVGKEDEGSVESRGFLGGEGKGGSMGGGWSEVGLIEELPETWEAEETRIALYLAQVLGDSRSLVLRSQNKRYRPAFFRKEDLEDSLSRASRQQRQLNPALRKGDIQVCVLEDIVKAMKESSAASKWDDIVFIPPGFNVSTDLTESAQG